MLKLWGMVSIKGTYWIFVAYDTIGFRRGLRQVSESGYVFNGDLGWHDGHGRRRKRVVDVQIQNSNQS